MSNDRHLIDIEERSKPAFRDLLVQNMKHSGATLLQQRKMAHARQNEEQKNHALLPVYDPA